MIARETAQLILDTAEIVDVVSDFVALKKRGANYLGLCPFHNEKTPSFTVSAAKGIYKCFGCGKSGHPVNFIMDHEQLGYPDALRFLARKYAIEIKEEAPDPEQLKSESEKESLIQVSEYAAQIFTEQLWQNEEGKSIGLNYFLKEREFSKAIMEKFRLGYCLQERTAFSDLALKNGFKKEFLVRTGLTVEKEERYFDRFSARVMFPIMNLTGRVIGFGGRTLSSDKKQAKYLNSPESEIYHKSQVLYGMFQAKKSIVEKDNCFLVEGYTDVISLHQAGVENVVASSGTSLTVEQIRLIRRFTRNITILYDGDNAGIKASFRGIDLVLAEGMNIRVLLFPDGDDPDSFARKTPTRELHEFIQQHAVDFITFKTQLLLKDTGNDPIKKSQLLHEIVDSIALVPDPLTRSLYVQECSKVMQTDEQLLLAELNRKIRKARLKAVGATLPAEEETQLTPVKPAVHETGSGIYDTEYQEREVLRLLINHGDKMIEVPVKIGDDPEPKTISVSVSRFVFAQIDYHSLQIQNEINKVILAGFREQKDTGKTPEQINWNTEEPDVQQAIAGYKMHGYEMSPAWTEKYRLEVPELDYPLARSVNMAISRLYEKNLMRMIKEITEEIQSAENDELLQDLIIKKKRLDDAKVELLRDKGTTTLF